MKRKKRKGRKGKGIVGLSTSDGVLGLLYICSGEREKCGIYMKFFFLLLHRKLARPMEFAWRSSIFFIFST